MDCYSSILLLDTNEKVVHKAQGKSGTEVSLETKETAVYQRQQNYSSVILGQRRGKHRTLS